MRSIKNNSSHSRNRVELPYLHGYLRGAAILACAAATLLVGCSDRKVPPTNVEATASGETAFHRMLVASKQDRWEDAWDQAGEVMIAHPNEPDKLESVARVAYRSGRHSEAADLLVEAVHADQWASDRRIQHALTALLNVGRLFDGIDLLRTAVERSPEKNGVRRILFDLLISTEQHGEAALHRRHLIRSRDFDLDLLLAGSLHERRTEEIASFDLMSERNPDDLRPKIGAAKQYFDEGLNERAFELVRSIVEKHPDFVAAQVLLGRTLVLLGRYDELASWSRSAPAAARSESDFWLTMGDWAVQQADSAAAIAAYAQAARFGGERVGPWQKLASLIAREPELANDALLIQRRADLLIRLRQDYAEANTRGIRTPESALAIASSFEKLGRMWEAEAWTAVGLTMNAATDEQKAILNQRRSRMIARLRSHSGWDAEIDRIAWQGLTTMSPDEAITRLTQSTISANSKEINRPQNGSVVADRVTLRFENEAEQRGLSFFGRTADNLSEPGVSISQMLGCGGGTIDYDLDGWPDVYLANAGGTPMREDSAAGAFFRNLGGFVHDVSVNAGVLNHGFGTGVCVGDVNEDGFDDLLVLNYGRNRIWINNGDGTFDDHSEQRLPVDAVWSTSAAIADIDADGLCDIVIANYCAGLQPTTLDCFIAKTKLIRACSPNQFSGEPDHFYAGTPSGRFVDVHQRWDTKPAILGRGLGVVAGHFDQEPGIDVLIANDMTPNHYWSGTSNGTSMREAFRLGETGSIRGIATDGQSRSQGSMGIAVADFNGDRLADFYISNYEYESNLLSLSQGTIGWRDQTSVMHLAAPTIATVGFGTQAIDFDNDGNRELIVTNGHVDDFRATTPESRYAQPIGLFSRNSNGQFDSLGQSIQCDYFQTMHIGRALWTIDINRDGKTDVLVTHQSEPTALLVNQSQTTHARIGFRLVATRDSRTAVGSVVTIATQAGNTSATAFLTSGDGYLCSNERCVRFGLGDSDSEIDVEVRWPGGEIQSWPALAFNQEWLLIQGEDAFALE